MSGEHNINPQSNEWDCETLAELLPAYSMGLTDAEETALVEQLLVHCPEYAGELETYKEIADSMLFSAPQVQPPASIAANLMKLTAQDAGSTQRSTAVRVDATRPVMPVVSPKIETPQNVVQPNFRRIFIALGSVAAAIILILLGVVAVLVNELNTLRADRDALMAQMQSQDEFLNVIGTGNVVEYALAAQQENSDATGTVIYNPERTVAMIRVENFPPLDPSMTYQAWLIQGDQRISAGIFDVNEMGQATFIFTAPQSLDVFEALGITQEPAGGSEGPTSTPLVAGSLETDSG